MSCLFYCICRHPGPVMAGPLLGVGGGPVYQVRHQRLSAAVSCVDPADLAPDLARVWAYERVVNSYHTQGTVIPMRYGSVLEQESQVISFLDEHDRHYEALLQELEGCVEMGLRVLLPAATLKGVSPGREAPREVADPPRPAGPPGRRAAWDWPTSPPVRPTIPTRIAGLKSTARPRRGASLTLTASS